MSSDDKKSVDAADKEPSQRSADVAAAEPESEGPTPPPPSRTAVDNFLLICENLPSSSDTEGGKKQKQAFRAAGMSLSRKDPHTFQLVFSSNQDEVQRGLQILKQ